MKRTTQLIFSFFIGNFLAILLFILSILGSTYVYLHFKKKNLSIIPSNAFLVIQLSDTFVGIDSKAQGLSAISASKERTIPLVYALRAIEKAKEDPKIAGIFIYGDTATQNGVAALHEIRSALKSFKSSKKPIIAYLAEPNFRDYYLASLADQITIHPLSWFDYKGLQAEILYLGDALKKYGIGVQITKVGKYKSMTEIFTQNQMTDANREQLTCLIEDLWKLITDETSADRQLTTLPLALEKGLFKPQEALKLGLIDNVAYLDEVTDYLSTLGEHNKKTHTFNQVHIVNYVEKLRLKNEHTTEIDKAKIGLLYIEGTIVDGEGTENEAGCERLARSIHKLRVDDSIKAVVVRIQSPGGSGYASERIQRELSLLKKAKPLVISFGKVAASGGYWIASDADAIFATPYTITGSIGAFGLSFNLQQLANDHGFTWDHVQIGEFADLQSIARPKSPEALALLQQLIENLYEVFISKVAQGRNMSPDEIELIAQGRIWSGLQAYQKGLITHLGNLQQAMQHAATLAHLEDHFSFQEFPEEKTFTEITAEWLGSKPTYPISRINPLGRFLKSLEQQLAVIDHLNDPHSVYTLLPIELNL